MEVCYRHPNRETGVSCSNCGRPICPDCMTTTSVGMRCPECASQRTRVRTMASTSEEPVLTYVLIGVNWSWPSARCSAARAPPGAASAAARCCRTARCRRRDDRDGEYWRLITAGFLHAGFFHLLFNMLSLYILGGLLEPASAACASG